MENGPDPLLLLLLALPVLFLFLGANSIWDANEAFYVETPHQMVQSGDYVNPSFNGRPRFNKPVLSYWIVAGFYRLFGESVAVERVAIALGALGIIAATFLIGRALRSNATGVVAALMVATAPRFVFFSRRIFIDVYVTLFMSMALACFVLALRRPEHRRRYLILMYAAIGLGVLTKGPVALVLPAAVIGAWLVLGRRLSDLRRLMLVPGTLIVLAVVLPWSAMVYAQHGWRHIRDFLLGENLGRFASAMTTEREPWFFIIVLFADLLMPWAPLLVLPMMTGWKRQQPGEPETHATIRRLLWLWVAVIVTAFSFSASKEDLYIFPVVPAAAVLIGDALVSSDFGRRSKPLRVIFTAVCVACIALAAVVFRTLGTGYYQIQDAHVVAVLLAGAGLGAVALTLAGRPATAFLVLAGGFVGLNYLLAARVLPGLERLKPVPVLARTIAERASPDAQVGFCNVVLPSLVYYVGKPITELDGVAHAEIFFNQYPEAWVLMSEIEWRQLQERVPGLCMAVRRPLFDAKFGDMLRGQPPPDVLLVTDKCR